MGAVADDGPFYYRVHSPVVLIEFDHHPGVAFDNVVPSRNHIHTLVRTPNGGDYGIDLLRQHHERFDHSARHPRRPDRSTIECAHTLMRIRPAGLSLRCR